ncbi:MAG TPA: DNA-directed RNA polymerase subunit omega [Pyrinomonadaceae bacterium]|nr:DNA-directed RNA polymerase subunit omega [Pyrinomonadaceae bacterium]
MKTRYRITKVISKTMAVVTLSLIGAAGWLQPVQAQNSDGSVRFTSYASIGIVPGQKIRLSVSNSETSTGNLSLSFSYYLAHGSHTAISVPVYESEWMRVPRGEFRFSELTREQLRTEGESGTGRAEVIVRVDMIAPAGSNPEDFPSLLEIIQDGTSAQVDSKYRLIILAAKRSKQLAPVSFVPGQRLSFTFFNPNEEGSQPVRVQAYIYYATGRLLRQTDPVELRNGDLHIVSVNYNEVSAVGEEGRLQVRAVIQAVLADGSMRTVDLPFSMQVVENRTGITQGGDYYCGTVTVSGDGE